MTPQLPLVSVITVNYNGRSLLDDCFSSLLALDYPADDLEIIMVDNGSSDGSVEYVKTRFPKVIVLVNDCNNYCRANNKGIAIARGRYIALINNDVKVDSKWLSALVRAMEGDPAIGAAGSKILFMDGSVESFGHRSTSDLYWHDIGFGDTDHRGYTLKEVESICGCSVLYRKECLDAVGLLDEDFNLYVEDVDMGIRCVEKGWKLVSCPESIIYHKFHGTIKNEADARQWQETNRLLLIAKHWPEKLVDALYGKGYFTVKSDDGGLRDFSGVLGKVFIKLVKEHGVERASAWAPDLFSALYRLYKFEKEFLVEELKSKNLVLSTEESQLAHKIQEQALLSLEKDQRLSSARRELSILAEQKDRVIAEKDQELALKKQQLASVKKEISLLTEQKDQVISEKNQILSSKEQQLASVKKEISLLTEQKDRVIYEKNQELAIKSQQLESVKKEISLKDQQLESVKKEISLKDQQLESVKKELLLLTEQKDRIIAEKNQKLSLKEQQLDLAKNELILLAEQKDRAISEKNNKIQSKEDQISERDKEIETFKRSIDLVNGFLKDREQELQAIYRSRGYRYLLTPLWNCAWPFKQFLRYHGILLKKITAAGGTGLVKEKLRANKRFMRFYHSDTLFSSILQKIYRYRNPWLKIYQNHLKHGTVPPSPRTLIMMLTRRCNLSCKFCDIKNTPEEMRTEDARKVIDNASRLGLQEVIITGGEPLLHKGIFEIIGYAKEKGIKTCITTNGVLVDGYFNEIVGSGVNVVSVSLDGLGQAHDDLRGKPGLAQAVQRDLLRLKGKGIIVSINFVLTNKNILDLEPTHEWARKNDIFFDFWPVNHCKELFINTGSDFARIKKFVRKLKIRRWITGSKYNYYSKMPFYLEGNKDMRVRCLALAGNIGVDTNGDITTCCVWNREKIDLGNALRDDLETLWYSQKYLVVRRSLFAAGCSADCYNACLSEFSNVTGKDFMFIEKHV